MDPEQLDLLRRISDEPDDDAPRLVYSDWLEEHGELAAAGFVRAQIGMERSCLEEPDEPGHALPSEQVRPEVFGPLVAPLLDVGLVECANRSRNGPANGVAFRFRRGLVEVIEVYGAQAAGRLAERVGDVLSRSPVKHLRIIPSSVLSYEADDPIRLTVLTRLLPCPQLRNLRSLSLIEHHLGESIAGLLLGLPHLRSDLALFLDGNQIGVEALAALQERFSQVRCNPYPFPMQEGEVPF